jgi:flagellar hook-length control protein FliK
MLAGSSFSSAMFMPSLQGQSSGHGGHSERQARDQVMTEIKIGGSSLDQHTTSDADPTSFDGLLSSSGSTSTSAGTANKTDLFAPMSFKQPQWTQDMSQRLGQMRTSKIDEISVRLDPASLGAINVRLKMQDDKRASVVFMAQNGLTKEMLENALPRLKELLAAQGIELNSSFVGTGDAEGQGFAHQDTNTNSRQHHTALESSHDADMTAVEDQHIRSPATNARVDHYA